MKKHLIFLFFLSLAGFSQAQSKIDVVKSYLQQTARSYNLSDEDIAEWVITDEHVSSISGINHLYLEQQFKGIAIKDAQASFHIGSNDELLKMNNQFVGQLKEKISSTVPEIRGTQAIEAVARKLGYRFSSQPRPLDNGKKLSELRYYSHGGISLKDIPLKLIYTLTDDDQLKLAWDMVIYELNDEHVWNVQVDAITGDVLKKTDRVIVCNHSEGLPGHQMSAVQQQAQNSKTSTAPIHEADHQHNRSMVGGYRVFPIPFTDPVDAGGGGGSRVLVNDPDDALASPFGWHDTDGVTGSEFTVTRGNNTWAERNYNSSNDFSPDGGTTLNFSFPLNLAIEEYTFDYLSASITNLFYWVNIAHDVLYHYGFDEASGNFQENNYGNGGTGTDYVNAETISSPGGCQDRFYLAAEGEIPRLLTYECNGYDGSYSSRTILHEYTHGLTSRLVGGASTISCLENDEAMDEGWSDWYSMMFTLEAGDAGADPINYISWLHSDPNGIRTFPYSTDMTIDSLTYDDLPPTDDNPSNNPNTEGVKPHRVGEIWAVMLWEMTWVLIDSYGFDPDLYNGTGGNNIALQLVTESLKLVPCSPGFVDARDAILAADQAIYNGINQCLIWEAFAKRGLGFSADQGSTGDVNDGTSAYDVPCSGCQNNFHITGGHIFARNYEANDNISARGVISTPDQTVFQAGGFIYLHTSFLAEAGSTFCALIKECDSGGGGFTSPDVSQYRHTHSSPMLNEASTTPQMLRISSQPNPFEQHTTFTFELTESSEVALGIYDISGRLIHTLIQQENRDSGVHTFEYDAQHLPKGIYLYRLSTKDGNVTKKMILK